jgi:hypothetical protein
MLEGSGGLKSVRAKRKGPERAAMHLQSPTPFVVSISLSVVSAVCAAGHHKETDSEDTFAFPPFVGYLMLFCGIIMCLAPLLPGAAGDIPRVQFFFMFCPFWGGAFLASLYFFRYRVVITDTTLTLGSLRRRQLIFDDVIDWDVIKGVVAALNLSSMSAMETNCDCQDYSATLMSLSEWSIHIWPYRRAVSQTVWPSCAIALLGFGTSALQIGWRLSALGSLQSRCTSPRGCNEASGHGLRQYLFPQSLTDSFGARSTSQTGRTPPAAVLTSGTELRSPQSTVLATSLVCPDVHLEQARFLDHTLVPLHTDLDQNDEPEVAQRGRSLDAYQAA